MVAPQPPARVRARRLAPDERRAALLAVATELFITRGPSFTTADLASAADVSEGTIFRYFPDKPSLISAAREGALGLDALRPELAAAAELPRLEDRLVAAGHVLSARITQMSRVMDQSDEVHGHRHDQDPDLIAELLASLVPLFDGVPTAAPDPSGSPDSPGSPEQLANVFLGMLVSNTLFCAKTSTPPMAIDHLVGLLVHGIAGRVEGSIDSGPGSRGLGLDPPVVK